MKPADAVSHLLALGWTETDLADHAGTSQPTINRIKHGASPSYETGKALVDLAEEEGCASASRKRKRKTA